MTAPSSSESTRGSLRSAPRQGRSLRGLALAAVCAAALLFSTGLRAATANLLVNPGAENGLTGWTAGGTSSPHTDNGSFNQGILPHSGSFDFLGGSGAAGTLSQTVSLTNLSGVSISDIDAGLVSATFSFWEQSLDQGSNSDGASVTLNFLNASLVSVGQISSPEITAHTGAWQNYANSTLIPAGARSVVYTMNFIRHVGFDLDAYIDDNSLIVSGRINWTGGGDGVKWSDPANWSGGAVPGANSDAFIGALSGDPTILIDNSAGTIQIHSLTTSAPLNITGGVLQATGTIQTSRDVILAGGTIKGGTLQETDTGALRGNLGTLDGVTLNANLDMSVQGASLVILNGLTLNGAASLGDGAHLDFQGTQTLDGAGSVEFLYGSANAFDVSVAGSTLTVASGIALHGGGAPGDYRETLGDVFLHGAVTLLLKGALSVDNGGDLTIYAPANDTISVANSIDVTSGGTLFVDGTLNLNSPGSLSATSGSTIQLAGSLLGNANGTGAQGFQGTLLFSYIDQGVAPSPQLLEAMCGDLGATDAGFAQAFAFGEIALTNASSVKLVNLSKNTNAAAEAVYADAVIVPAGCTLDLNGIPLYAHSVQISGGVIGNITLVATSNGTWTGAGDGFSWRDARNWSGNELPSAGSDVTIPALAGGRPILIDQSTGAVQIHSLTTSRSIQVAGSSLSAAAGMQLSADLFLAGGAITGTIDSPNGSAVVLTASGGTLATVIIGPDGTIDGTRNNAAYAYVTGDLTLNGRALLGSAGGDVYSELFFTGSQSFNGSGQVIFGNASGNGIFERTAGSGILTIAASLSIQGGSGAVCAFGTAGATETVVNNAPINIPAGQSLIFGGGSWTNNGAISASGATVTLRGAFTLSSLAQFTLTGASLLIAGTLDNAGQPLLLDGSTGAWTLAGGAIANALITVSGNGRFSASSGVLDGSTLNSDALFSGGTVIIRHGLTLANHAKLTLGDSGCTLSFQGSQMLGGIGEVILSIANPGNGIFAQGDGTSGGATLLTIGNGILIHGAAGGVLRAVYPFDGFLNQGAIVSDAIGQAVHITGGAFTNTGALNAVHGGAFYLDTSLSVNGAGQLSTELSSTTEVGGDLLGSSTGSASQRLLGPVIFAGAGAPAAPQRLEARSNDLGDLPSAFVNNSSLGRLTVSGSTYLQLVDFANNSGSGSSEAVYADKVTVSAGATLDLNGLHLYTHSLLKQGTVIGSITLVPDPVLFRVASGANPTAAALNPLSHRLYVANGGDGTVTVVEGGDGSSRVVTVGSNPVALAIDPEANQIYVANQGSASVAVIDGLTEETTTLQVGGSPSAIVVNPNTKLVYVANRADSTVTVIDAAGLTVAGTVNVGASPSALAVNILTNKIYVANFGSAGAPSPASIIDGATLGVVSVAAGTGSNAVAVNPVTNRAYVANATSGTLTVIDGATNQTATIPAGVQPSAVAVNPATNEIYVANQGDGTVSVINGATRAVASIPVGTAPVSLSVDVHGGRVYVANSGGSTIGVIDGATGTVSSVDCGPVPITAAVDPLTSRLYAVTQGDGTISLLDASAPRLTHFALGAAPSAAAFNPVTQCSYCANAGSNTVTVTDLTGKTLATVGTGLHPVAVAVDFLRNRIYVANDQDTNVTVIDGESNTASWIACGSNPCALGIDLAANRVYVANRGSGDVTVIDGATSTTASFKVGAAPSAVAVNPVTGRVFIANAGSATVSTIDGGTNQTHQLTVGLNPTAIAVNPATDTVYVANTGSATVTAFNGTNLISASPLATPVGSSPNALAVNPLTNQIYVSGGENGNGSVTVIDGSSNTIAATLPAGSLPSALSIDLACNRLYVANRGSKNLTAIDTATLHVAVLDLPDTAQAVSVDPASGLVAAACGTQTGAVGVLIDPGFAGGGRLTASLDGPPGNAATGSTAAIGIETRSFYSPSAPAVRQIYYQFDTIAGPWLSCATTGPMGAAPLAGLPLGAHVLYALAADGQEATSAAGAGPICGQIAAYPFVATGGGTFAFATAATTARNSDSAVSVTVVRDFALASGHVDYQALSGTAVEGTNFKTTLGTLNFAPGEFSKTISVPLINQGAADTQTYFSIHLSYPSGSSGIGSPTDETVFLLNDSVTADLALSNFHPQLPGSPPTSGSSIAAHLTPDAAGGAWRLAGENEWRESDSVAVGLAAAYYAVEFRPAAGYATPPSQFFFLDPSAAKTLDAEYLQGDNGAAGSLQVNLAPAGIGGWQLEGGAVHQGGETLGGLSPGSYIVEFVSATGLIAPENREVIIASGQTSTISGTYYVGDAPVGQTPELVDDLPAGSPQGAAQAMVGQLQTDSGFGTGFVPLDRVVATAAHVIFDDGSLSYAQGIRWFFQRDTGVFQAPAQIPRGAYLLAGYATQRAADHTPGVSSTASQQLDVAALYFLEPAARGGQSGYLASNAAGNPWLTNVPASNQRPKFIAGYPVSGIDPADKGRLFATPTVTDAFRYVTGSLFDTDAIASYPGSSGGPLLVAYTDPTLGLVYLPAAIYLGGTAQTVVRAIDGQAVDLFARAQATGLGGANTTGPNVLRIDAGLSGTTQAVAGSVNVLIQPAGAISAARWGFVPDLPSRRSGEQALNIPPGSYQVGFSAVAGYDMPADVTVRVKAGEQSMVSVLYLPEKAQISSPAAARAVVGAAFSYQAAAAPDPLSYVCTGLLPDGVSFDPATGVLAGVPTLAGSFPLTLQANNARGLGDPFPLLLQVLSPRVLTVSVTPPKSGSVTPALAGVTQQAVGSTLSITASAQPGFVFDHWSSLNYDGTTTIVARHPTYSFLMPDNLSLQAAFIPSPYLRAPGDALPLVVGVYSGVALGSPNGAVTLKVDSKGGFSGTLWVGVQRYPLHGTFDGQGGFAGNVSAGKGSVPVIVTLQLDVTQSTQRLLGTISSGSIHLLLQADRNPFSKLHRAPQALGRAAGANYAIILPHSGAADAPGGDGFGTLTVTADGNLHFAGVLGDGAPASQGTTLGKDGEWPVFVLPYPTGGTLAGRAAFSATGAAYSVGGPLNWNKTMLTGKAASSQNYPNGFATNLNMRGAPLGAAAADGLTQASFAVSGGGVSLPTLPFSVSFRKGVGSAAGSPAFNMKINTTTGLFNGVFPDPSNILRPFHGILLPGANAPAGFGYFSAGQQTGAVEF